MGNKFTEFIYDGSFQNRPKNLQNNVFVLYSRMKENEENESKTKKIHKC